MDNLLTEFLASHPHVEQEFAKFLLNKRAATPPPHMISHQNGGGDSCLPGCPACEAKKTANPAASKKTLADVCTNLPTPPAKGKALGTVVMFRYISENEVVKRLVYEEFFSQVSFGNGEDIEGCCWTLKDHVTVKRNARGALVKKVQIRHLAKPVSAVLMSWFLTKGSRPEENLYNTCGNERCVSPHHHTPGRNLARQAKKGKIERTGWGVGVERLSFEDTQDLLETILDFMKKEPENGATLEELSARFIKSGDMTENEFKSAMRLGTARSTFYRRITDNRLFLKGYPSKTRMEAAQRRFVAL